MLTAWTPSSPSLRIKWMVPPPCQSLPSAMRNASASARTRSPWRHERLLGLGAGTYHSTSHSNAAPASSPPTPAGASQARWDISQLCRSVALPRSTAPQKQTRMAGKDASDKLFDRMLWPSVPPGISVFLLSHSSGSWAATE